MKNNSFKQVIILSRLAGSYRVEKGSRSSVSRNGTGMCCVGAAMSLGVNDVVVDL